MRNGGPTDVWIWVYGHGVPMIFGIPIVKYHRITDNIFLGPQHGKLGRRLLGTAGITASLNLRSVYCDVDHGVGFSDYLHLSIKDMSPPTLAQLREGAEFIHRVIDDGGRVYVHCQGGLGRSPTMVAAFLINEGRSLEEACRMIYAVRPFTAFEPSQLERLKEFEREIRRTSRDSAEDPVGKIIEPQELQL